MSGLLRPLGSAGLSPSHHWQPWYKAQLGAHLLPPFLLPPSLTGPSYSICLFWQPESILKVPGGEWNQSCYALSMITRQSGLSTSKYQISFLRDPSVFRKTHSMSDTYLLTCGVLCTFFLGGDVLFPEHSKQFPTLWPFSQLFFRKRCHPITVISQALLVWQGPSSGLFPLQSISKDSNNKHVQTPTLWFTYLFKCRFMSILHARNCSRHTVNNRNEMISAFTEKTF